MTKDERKIYSKNWHSRIIKDGKNYSRIRYEKKIQDIEWIKKERERGRRYYAENRNRLIEYEKKYHKNKIVDEKELLKRRLIARHDRLRLNDECRSIISFQKIKDIIGCSIEHLMLWFECYFYNNPETGKEMNWNNLKEWEIDHNVPCHKINKDNILDILNYKNLYPKWAKDNRNDIKNQPQNINIRKHKKGLFVVNQENKIR